jgi:hypothetical protein
MNNKKKKNDRKKKKERKKGKERRQRNYKRPWLGQGQAGSRDSFSRCF